MPYSFVWLYLFKFVSHAQFCWSNTKTFLSILIVFGKSFVFAKISKKLSKTVLPCSGDLVTGQTNRMSLITSLHRSFLRLTSKSMLQSWKRLRKFSKFWVFKSSRDSVWRLVHEWKLQSQGYTEFFTAPFATSSWVYLPITKNTSKFFSKILSKVFGGLTWQLVRDLVQRQKTCILRFKDSF